MKRLLTILLLLPSYLFALDADAIKKLAEEPHDRSNLIEELTIYSDARLYKATMTSGAPGEERQKMPETLVREKTVEGRFIVSEIKFPEEKQPLIMVVTYDKIDEIYKKWVLLPNGQVSYSIGIGDLKNRTMAWASQPAPEGPPVVYIGLEKHTDDRSTWKETLLFEGKVMNNVHGTAVKVE